METIKGVYRSMYNTATKVRLIVANNINGPTIDVEKILSLTILTKRWYDTIAVNIISVKVISIIPAQIITHI